MNYSKHDVVKTDSCILVAPHSFDEIYNKPHQSGREKDLQSVTRRALGAYLKGVLSIQTGQQSSCKHNVTNIIERCSCKHNLISEGK